MSDASHPKAKSQRQKTTFVRVRRQKTENERRTAAGGEKLTTTNAVRMRQAAKGWKWTTRNCRRRKTDNEKRRA